MISNATNSLKESRKESLLRCAGSTSICMWLVCDLVVMCVQAVGDRALGDLCVSQTRWRRLLQAETRKSRENERRTF